MRDIFKGKAKRWFAVGGLLLLMSITSVGYAQAASLTDTEKDWLIFMREEEKLARDVYIFLYDMWNSLIFNNISVSEQRHIDAIKTLLVKYNIPDPAAGKGLGEFTDPELQALYGELTYQGAQSLVEALKVGVSIEVRDIADLTARIAETERRDIERVYSNLRLGSINHWDAFCSHLVKLGERCEPYELPEP